MNIKLLVLRQYVKQKLCPIHRSKTLASTSVPEDGAESAWGQTAGGAVQGGVVDVVCVAGGAVAGGVVAGSSGYLRKEGQTGSREDSEEASTGGLWAANAPRVDVHEMVVVEGGHCRGYHRRTSWWRRKREGLVWRASQLDVSSSAGKPTAGGGAFPKKVQGRRRATAPGLVNHRKTEANYGGQNKPTKFAPQPESRAVEGGPGFNMVGCLPYLRREPSMLVCVNDPVMQNGLGSTAIRVGMAVVRAWLEAWLLAVEVLVPALHPAEVAIICRIGALQAKISQELKPNSSGTTGMGGHICRAETAHLRRQSILTAMPDVRLRTPGTMYLLAGLRRREDALAVTKRLERGRIDLGTGMEGRTVIEDLGAQ
ncbi:hypothetical protein DFH08DRAFT_827986 [Mycena albidolilacea]|uniref:Uncharacterized protein n=1 Tax=Mycena albidolilacea TaxID=1033008 RepID=A0AAD6YX06_9AGAR|nr:hypothetical protein DFH08DRAFT_827986 [Mycena albidolilacea]